MDSGNSSGSLQSSSGGDEEYDSRAEESSFSAAFMINNSPPSPQNHGFGLGPFTSPSTSATATNNFANSHSLPQPQQQQQQRHHNNTHMLDPLSNYMDPMQRSPSSSLQNSNALLNLDMMWSKPARSGPNPTDLGGLLIPGSSSSSQPQQINHALLSAGHQVPGQTTRDSHSSGAAFLALPDSQQGQGGSRGLLSVSAANNNDLPHSPNTNVVRNPKKRSRASRRAPTTVLTTDTTNFRAMVQEFTGIPAQPFTSSSSPFPRTRFDLFGSAAVTTTSSRLLDPSSPVPPYLLRPFPQKLHHHHLHPFPPTSSNSMVDSLLASNNSTNSVTNNSSTSINYQLSSASAADHLGLLKHPLNFNMHNTTTTTNPILTFQNILQQPPPKYPLGNPSSLASKTQPSLEIPPPSGDSHLKVGVFEELALRGHAHVSTTNVSALHHNTVSGGNASTEWAQITGTITNDDREHGGGKVGRHGVAVNYSNVAERVTNGKVHYPASSSDFRGEKGTECTVSARSEGMVESWINCSSDN